MKEPSSLPDIQYSIDSRSIALDDVGISQFLTRIYLADELGNKIPTPAQCSFSAGLEEKLKGSHLSRFVEASELLQEELLSSDLINKLLDSLIEKLQTTSASIQLSFDYLFQKAAPASGRTALTGCEVVIEASKLRGETTSCSVEITVPVSTTCPCSKAISDEGAHNQRTNISVSLALIPGAELPSITKLYTSLEECGSAPVYPLLKRIDEKFLTEKQFQNPKFVEDVAREVVLKLRSRTDLIGYSLHIESLESIHAHNAFVSHSELF